MRSNPTFQEVEVVIHALPPSAATPEQVEVLCSALAAFVAANDNPQTSAHLKASSHDRLDSLVGLLARPELARSADACTLVLKAMRILARRQDNRQRCSMHIFQALLPFLSVKQQPAVASEAANAVLNLAYEAANVAHLVRCKCEAALLALLAGGQEEVMANAAGAVQTVCYQREGREAVRRAGGVGVLVKLLLRDALGPKVRQRVVGALHNLSSEADAVRLVREQGGIPPLAAVLRCADAGTAAAAVGALQNLSREAASCGVLLEQEGAVEALAELLASEDVQVAACAAGVLLNMHKLSRGKGSVADQESLTKGLTGVLSAAAIYGSLFRAPPCVRTDPPAQV